jgi:hypothetical protein
MTNRDLLTLGLTEDPKRKHLPRFRRCKPRRSSRNPRRAKERGEISHLPVWSAHLEQAAVSFVGSTGTFFDRFRTPGRSDVVQWVRYSRPGAHRHTCTSDPAGSR